MAGWGRIRRRRRGFEAAAEEEEVEVMVVEVLLMADCDTTPWPTAQNDKMNRKSTGPKNRSVPVLVETAETAEIHVDRDGPKKRCLYR